MQFIFSIIILIVLVPLAIAGISMAPWVPTRKKDVKRVQELLMLKPGDRFLEIGCGDGRISCAIAQKFPKNSILGIEIAFPMYIIAIIRKNMLQLPNVSLKIGNAFKWNFANFEHIYVYGMPDKMQTKIVPKFLKEAKSGAKLYSYVFSIPDEYKENAVSYGEKDQAKIHILEKK